MTPEEIVLLVASVFAGAVIFKVGFDCGRIYLLRELAKREQRKEGE